MKNLYALLIGINKYNPPNTPLYGCIKDVNKVEKYIKDYHEDDFNLHIKKLIDEEATYANIIDGFRSHLSLAEEDDMVWFHFSGHGSEEKSAREFASLEPNGKDQTLWCVDSGSNGVFNLADKELAVLIHEVSTKRPDGSTKESAPHIMVSLDCCHSGSGTRDAGEPDTVRTRNARSTGNDRPIDSYVNGYYAKQGANLQVPSAPHIVLSACQTYQRAGDLNDGGAFTSGMIRALKSSKGQINYADLFIRTRASVRQIRDNQVPDFSAIENFNPYQRFLATEELGDPRHYEVFFEKNKWYIRCGAIHGLPTNNDKTIKVEIRSFPKNNKLGTATIASVGAQRSALDIGTQFSIRSTMKEIAPGEDHYRGVIMSFPAPPLIVSLVGDTSHVSAMKKYWPDESHIQYTAEVEGQVDIIMKANKESFSITDVASKSVVHEIDISNKHDIDIDKVYEQLFQSYSKIGKWYSFLGLENENKASKIKDWVDLNLYVYDAQGNINKHGGTEVTLYAGPENSKNGQFGFMPKAHIKKTTQDLFLYLMYMQPNFAIDCPEGEIVFYAAEYSDVDEMEMALWKNIQGFGPGFEDASVTSHFKLLVTTEKLDYFQFLQSSLGDHRSALSLWQPDKVSDDWLAINMTVTICRQEKEILHTEETEINNKLKVEGNAQINASLLLSPMETSGRQQHKEDSATLLQHKGFSLIDLRDNKKARHAQSLELHNIKLDDEQALIKNPLRLNISEPCDTNEMIVPMAFDGKYFRVVGEGSGKEGGSAVTINRLPSIDMAGQKGGKEEVRERGVFSSLKMAFFKLVMNDENPNKLSAVIYEDDEFKLTSAGMAQRIMTSSSFLLVLHGIMGDGLTLCKEFAVNNPDVIKKYDCILVYDYECLNTPLDETAKLLKQELTNLSLDQHKNKTLDIVAHSCGGLVARWLIEREGGNTFINDLVLIGTPNSGSLFGKVEEYRSFALNTLEFAANFMPHIIPGSGLLIKVLKFAGNLTPALGQMSPDSNFLTQLNTSSDPEISYTIVSGDARHVESNHAAALVKKLYGESTRSTSSDATHDLFASIESAELRPIFDLRKIKPRYHDAVPAHHFSLVQHVKMT